MPEASPDTRVISKVQIYSSASIIRGSVLHEPGQRLLDLLNLTPAQADIHGADFFWVNNASVDDGSVRDSSQPLYVNKAHILCIAEEEIEGVKRTPDALYPYVTKEVVVSSFMCLPIPLPVKYIIRGNTNPR
jgi:hypothetical protein